MQCILCASKFSVVVADRTQLCAVATVVDTFSLSFQFSIERIMHLCIIR